METKQKTILNVTDLSKYLYCPRQFYLEKVLGVKKPMTKEMAEGRIRHSVLELFSNNERRVIEQIESKEGVEQKFKEFLKEAINHAFYENEQIINNFKINKEELAGKIEKQINKEIILRVKAIENTLKKGFFGKELWENLEPKYYSEFMVSSDSLGLKGRVDRLVIDKKEIIPFELKSREIDRVFESDEIQVSAYVMLLEHYFDRKVDFGVLEAGDTRFQIEVDDNKRKKVLELINEIQTNLSKKFPSSFAKCEKCGYKKECDELE
jgi:CRISPR-associated protein Cas4